MEIIQNVMTDSAFDQELIKRFFHPKSYFFYCVSHHLNHLLDESSDVVNEDYLYFGNLMDRLVAAQDKIAELEALAEIPKFADFYAMVKQTVTYLRETDLHSEQMKIEIERLARGLVATSLECIHDREGRRRVEQYLGISREETPGAERRPGPEPADAQSKADFASPTLAPEADVRPDDLEPEQTLTQGAAEPPSTASGAAQATTTPDVSSEDSESEARAEQDVPEPPSREARETQKADSEAHEGGSAFNSSLSESDTPARGVDPGAMVQVFSQEVARDLLELESVLQQLRGDTRNVDLWTRVLSIFESIREIAMIHGFDPFEHVALKAQLLFAAPMSEFQERAPDYLPLMHEVLDFLKELNRKNAQDFDEERVRALVDKLSTAEVRFAAPEPSRPAVEPDREESPGEVSEEMRSEDIRKEEEAEQPVNGESPEARSEGREASEPPPQPGASRTPKPMNDLRLPGEDDDELRSLVAEIATHDHAGDKGPETGPTPSEAQAKRSGALQAHPLGRDGELYFKVMRSALEIVAHEPDHRAALQELRSAARSTRRLCDERHLAQLARLPEAIESLVSGVLERPTALIYEGRTAIEEALATLRSLRRPEDIHSPAFQEMVERLHRLKVSLTGKRLAPDASQPNGSVPPRNHSDTPDPLRDHDSRAPGRSSAELWNFRDDE